MGYVWQPELVPDSSRRLLSSCTRAGLTGGLSGQLPRALGWGRTWRLSATSWWAWATTAQVSGGWAGAPGQPGGCCPELPAFLGAAGSRAHLYRASGQPLSPPLPVGTGSSCAPSPLLLGGQGCMMGDPGLKLLPVQPGRHLIPVPHATVLKLKGCQKYRFSKGAIFPKVDPVLHGPRSPTQTQCCGSGFGAATGKVWALSVLHGHAGAGSHPEERPPIWDQPTSTLCLLTNYPDAGRGMVASH